MPTPSTARLPLPKDEDEFDSIVRDALALRFSDPSFKRYGRRGQNQNGIDGLAEDSGPNAGMAWQATLQQSDLLNKLKKDLEKLDASSLRIRHLLFCVGTARDALLRNEIGQISLTRAHSNKCSLEVLFWDDICDDICRDQEVVQKHFRLFAGTATIHEHGFMMLGMDLCFDAAFLSMTADRWTVRFRSPFRGGVQDVSRYIADFDTMSPEERFVVSERIGQGRLLATAPTLDGQILSLHLSAAPPRRRVSSYNGGLRLDETGDLDLSSDGLQMIEGTDAAIQTISTALSFIYGESVYAPKAGSRCSEFFHQEADKSIASRLFGLELARFAYVPEANASPLNFIRTVTSMEIQNQEPDSHGRISVEAELLLEGHGRWRGTLGVFVGNAAPQIDRASVLREAKDLGFYSDEAELTAGEDSLTNLEEMRGIVAFAEELETALAIWDDKRDDLEFCVFDRNGSEKVRDASQSVEAFLRLTRKENDALRGLIRTFDTLVNRAFQQTFSTDGTVISERRKSYFIQRWSGLYKDLLDWGLQWEMSGAPDEFHGLFEIQRRKALSFANEVRSASSRLRREVQAAIDDPGKDVHISLRIDSDDEDGSKFDRELRKAVSAIDPRLTELEEEP